MKVYVMTKCYPYHPELFVGVKASRKAAEDEFKIMFPSLKYDPKNDCFLSDKTAFPQMLFIREHEI